MEVVCKCTVVTIVSRTVINTHDRHFYLILNTPPRWRSRLEHSPRMRKVWEFESQLRQTLVETAALRKARQEVYVSRVLGDDHYKRMPRVTVGVAR